MNLFLDILKFIFGTGKEGDQEPSGNLIELLTALEGFSNVPYADPVGLGTIGVGHLITKNDTNLIKVAGTDDVKELGAHPLANSQVKDLLKLDLEGFRAHIRGLGVSLKDYEEDALVSFIFNIGIGSFNRSTLRKMLIAQRNRVGIASEFAKWRLADRKILTGLQVRRAVEASIFLGLHTVPDYLLRGVPEKNHARVDELLKIYWG